VLSEATSAAGRPYLSGWAGASNLVAFRGEPDEKGQPTWRLFLVERQPREGTGTGNGQARQREPAQARPQVSQRRPGAREPEAARQRRTVADVLARHGDLEPDDTIPF
jgi:hypothetical protein